MHAAIKSLVRRTLVLPRAGAVFAPFLRDRATVFMLHRFRRPGIAVPGHDPDGLRRVLAHLRRERYVFMDLEDLVRRMAGDEPLPRHAVAFTIDDGYADQADIGAPVFREFDCPVTTFVTSGFLDGNLWFWWDQIEYVFRHTHRPSLALPLEDEAPAAIRTSAQRDAVQAAFVASCKAVSDAQKHEAIRTLAERAEVDLPSRPPEAYAPMSWNDLRRCEDRGMRFGPHTETHPILARVGDAETRREIAVSWERLRQEARQPAPIFCYPNGQKGDYGPREIDFLREAGFLAAVVGSSGYVSRDALLGEPRAFYELPRFSYDSDVSRVIQCASGLERFKDLLRGAAS